MFNSRIHCPPRLPSHHGAATGATRAGTVVPNTMMSRMHLGCRSLAVAPRGLCAAHRLGMGLSAQPPDSTPAATIGLPMVRHHLAGVRDGCVPLQLVY